MLQDDWLIWNKTTILMKQKRPSLGWGLNYTHAMTTETRAIAAR